MNGFLSQQLWPFALAAVPVACLVAIACRCLPCRPSTRHGLWLVPLFFLVVVPFLPQPWDGLVHHRAPDRAEPTVVSTPAPVLAPAALPSSSGEGIAQISSPEDSPETGASSAAPARAGTTADNAPSFSPHSLVVPRTFGDPAPFILPGSKILDETASSVPGNDADSPRRSAARASNAPAWNVQRPDTHPAPGDAPGAPDAPARPAGLAAPLAPPLPAAADSTPADEPGAAPAEPHRSNLARLLTLRDAVLDLPSFPASLWLAGAAAMLMLVLIRALRFRRLIRAAEPAPPSVAGLVADAAEHLSLRKPPRTLMVRAPIAPLVWCGREILLMLPVELWEQLDETGRRAVLFHELAHLKRNDHWICRASLLVSIIYWWHPVVWWVRRRLREEADMCCDAWVTALMPSARAAYARALLETRKFTSSMPPAEPAVGLGVSTNRARKLARRITMVMSHQIAPRTTLGGVVLTCMVATGMWLAAPALACPPSKEDAPKAEAKLRLHLESLDARRAPKAPKAPAAPRAGAKDGCCETPSAPEAPSAPAAPGSTFEQFHRQRGGGSGAGGPTPDGSFESRLRRLEQQLNKLNEELKRWGDEVSVDVQMPEIPHVELSAVLADDVRNLIETSRGAYQAAVGAFSQESPQAEGQRTVRSYELPSGKLKSLSQLMLLKDVPVLVSAGEDSIEVHATPEQHRAFEAFVVMIDGEESVQHYRLPKEKLDSLIELMRRDDVPIFIEIHSESVAVHGTDLEQAVFKSFVDLIHPEGARTSDSTSASGRGEGRAAAGGGGSGRSVPESSAQQNARRAEIRELQNHHRALERQIQDFEKRAEQLRRRVEEHQSRARQKETEIEKAEQESEGRSGSDRREAIRRMHELKIEAMRIEHEAAMAEVEVEAIEAQIEAIEAEAEGIEDRMEEIEEQIGEIEESHEDEEEVEDPEEAGDERR